MRLVPALAALLVTHVLFFHDVLFGHRSLSPATFTSGLTPSGPFGAPPPSAPPHLLDVEGAAWVDEPSPYLVASGWRAMEPPLWTPAEGLGAPLAANLNSGAANPLHLPLALWPGPLAFDLFALARLALLGIGTTVFLGELTLAPVATLAGAVVTAYGGYAMAWIVHHPLSAELFLPFMLAGFERGRRGARGGWTVLALATAGSLVGGKLQASLLCLALLAAYAIVRATRAQGGRGRTTRAAAAVTAALGITLAAYLLVPAAELMARASGLTLGARAALAGFTQPWPTLAAVALPRLFIPVGHAVADGLPLPPAIGMVATVLALVGVVAGRSPHRRVARFFALWAAVLLLRNAGVFGRDWMTIVPVVRGIFFLKYTFTVAFALAVTAAIGLDAIARGLVSRVPASTATLLLVATVLELRFLAPAAHPPRLDPYRPPPYVEFLRGAPRARVLAADGLMTPLTSAAVGLRDLRAIDVLTPGTTYAFFTRLVSFCSRIIHFTVDPDLPLAATAPAVDLAGVRWIVSRGELDFHDLDARVARQIGHERLARLLAGLRSLRTVNGDLALGTIASGAERHFALSLTTPFTLELEAESEAPVLAWDVHVAGAAARVSWRIATAPAASAESTGDVASRRASLEVAPTSEWTATRVTLGDTGIGRRVRVRITGRDGGAGRARVDLGDLGFSDGPSADAARLATALTRHRDEVAALVPVFRDEAVGAVVYENRNALPRAFRVTAYERVASIETALTRLADGFDFRTGALVTATDDAVAAAGAAAAAAPHVEAEHDHRAGEPDAAASERAANRAASSWGGTTIVKDDAEAVIVATDGAARALVVLADLDYPGWQATIDGRPVPILTTDGLLRGVLVPPGPHCLEYRYQPRSWLVGLVVTVLAALLLPVCARRAAAAHRKRVPAFARVV
ncbi:MAG: YfhO family protein [Deltaproteobacteria bacterium]|nr:MAG: YfhO family protein [Deltaproteobacteria bacterium]